MVGKAEKNNGLNVKVSYSTLVKVLIGEKQIHGVIDVVELPRRQLDAKYTITIDCGIAEIFSDDFE